MRMKTKVTMAAAIFAVTAMAGHAQTEKKMESGELKKATFGAGCFWCSEAVFLNVNGVSKVVSGYSGGKVKNPSYREVCTGLTGHAEVTQITYDPKVVSFEDLLEVFWQAHDPTTLNRQGADEGTQYRSVIFYHNEQQKLIAEKSKLAAQADFSRPIVTEIVPFTKFYPAEDYHQGYYDLNSRQPYCQMVITPKLEKLEHKKVIEPTPQTPK